MAGSSAFSAYVSSPISRRYSFNSNAMCKARAGIVIMVFVAALGTAGCWLNANNRSSLNSPPKTDKNQRMYTYLALGDSYTIGESVPMAENFPHQVVELLKQ